MTVNIVVPFISKLLLENERVKVFEMDFKPGEKTDMHEHPGDYVVYPLSDGCLKFTNRDGQSQEQDFKVGEAGFQKAGWHIVENIGDTEVRGLVVELKG